MHRILKTHLEAFAESFGLSSDPEQTKFEKFSNYAILSPRVGSNFDIDDVTTGNNDKGIDGIAIIVNEEVFVSKEDLNALFSQSRRNHDVEIIVVQSKTSESFDLGEFLKFKEAVLAFVNEDLNQIDDEVHSQAVKMYSAILQNVPKIRHGKPSLTVRYVTAGNYQHPSAFEEAHKRFCDTLNELGLFHVAEVEFVDRDTLT